MTYLHVWSPVGARVGGVQPMLLSHISVSLSLFLPLPSFFSKINKHPQVRNSNNNNNNNVV